jgi:MFS family permease
MTFSLAARGVSIGIPLLVFPGFRPDFVNPLVLMAVLLAISQALQSVAYLAFLSWIADLAPEEHWGRFFSIRNIAKVSVLLVVPVAGGYLRDWWRREVPAEEAMLAYAVAFAIGLLLLLLSMIPVLRLPDVNSHSELPVTRKRGLFREAFRDRSMRFLLIHNWWLAIANGLTQVAFFGFLFGPLGVGLGTFYLLMSVMRAVKLPVSWFTGKMCDRRGNKWPLFFGLLLAAMAMPFWLIATPDQWWWIFGAYAMWGFFAGANIAGRNLVLTLSPRGDNTVHLGLFRLIGGLLAGASGLLGALWLDSLLKNKQSWELAGWVLNPYQLLFLISFLGRLTALIWILPIREPGRNQHHLE